MKEEMKKKSKELAKQPDFKPRRVYISRSLTISYNLGLIYVMYLLTEYLYCTVLL